MSFVSFRAFVECSANQFPNCSAMRRHSCIAVNSRWVNIIVPPAEEVWHHPSQRRERLQAVCQDQGSYPAGIDLICRGGFLWLPSFAPSGSPSPLFVGQVTASLVAFGWSVGCASVTSDEPPGTI